MEGDNLAHAFLTCLCVCMPMCVAVDHVQFPCVYFLYAQLITVEHLVKALDINILPPKQDCLILNPLLF